MIATGALSICLMTGPLKSFSDTLENDTGLLPWKGIGWYRKHFTLNETDKGKRIILI